MTTSAGTKIMPIAWLDRDNRLIVLESYEEEMSFVADGRAIPDSWMPLQSAPSAPAQAGKLVGKLRAYIPVEGQDGLRIRERLMREAAAEIERLSAAATVGKIEVLEIPAFLRHPQGDKKVMPLRACPFCSTTPILDSACLVRDTYYWVRCVNQKCTVLPHGMQCLKSDEAIAAWNNRQEVKPATDEKGRPLTHWGGMAEKVDAGSAEPVAVIIDSQFADFGDNRIRAIKLSLGVNLYDDDELYTRPPAPKTAWIDAATVDRNSRPPAPKVSDEKVREIMMLADDYAEIAAKHHLGKRPENDAQAARHKLLEALELDAGRKDAWMPIETAPKDGTVILLHRSFESLCGYGPSVRPKKVLSVGYYDIYWINGYPGGHGSGGGDDQFTHWQPLPAAPDSGQEAEG